MSEISGHDKFHKLEIPINNGNSPESKPHVDPTAINNALIRGGACTSHDNLDVCSDLVELDDVNENSAKVAIARPSSCPRK